MRTNNINFRGSISVTGEKNPNIETAIRDCEAIKNFTNGDRSIVAKIYCRPATRMEIYTYGSDPEVYKVLFKAKSANKGLLGKINDFIFHRTYISKNYRSEYRIIEWLKNPRIVNEKVIRLLA